MSNCVGFIAIGIYMLIFCYIGNALTSHAQNYFQFIVDVLQNIGKEHK